MINPAKRCGRQRERKMRDIRFRAWDKVDKVMLDWNCICQTAWNCQSVHAQKIATTQFEPLIYRILMNYASRFILMQSTGLKDRNGGEIYEGDIYIDHFWNERWFDVKREAKIPDIYCLFDRRLYKKGMYIEIIGNRFDNSELLETDK